MRRGFTILEVVISAMILAVVAVPLLEVFQSGMRTTRATIQEIVGGNLAAELAEQIETVPFEVVKKVCGGDAVKLSSDAGSLQNMAVLDADSKYFFHLAPLPEKYHRALTLRLVESDLVWAEIEVGWTVGGRRERGIVLRRYLVRDSLLPE